MIPMKEEESQLKGLSPLSFEGANVTQSNETAKIPGSFEMAGVGEDEHHKMSLDIGAILGGLLLASLRIVGTEIPNMNYTPAPDMAFICSDMMEFPKQEAVRLIKEEVAKPAYAEPAYAEPSEEAAAARMGKKVVEELLKDIDAIKNGVLSAIGVKIWESIDKHLRKKDPKLGEAIDAVIKDPENNRLVDDFQNQIISHFQKDRDSLLEVSKFIYSNSQHSERYYGIITYQPPHLRLAHLGNV